MKRAVIFDWDGTTFLGTDPLPHTAGLLDECRSMDARAVLVTNNSSRRTSDYRAILERHGLWSDNLSVVTSNLVAIDYLKTSMRAERVFLLGNAALKSEFADSGLILDNESPQAVVVGFDTSLSYDTLQTAHRLIAEGCPFIATHGDRVCPTADGGLIDCGAFIAALTASTGQPPLIIGKPEQPMCDYLKRDVLEDVTRAIVVGDRADTDGKLADTLGVPFVQVPAAVTDEAGRAIIEKIHDLMQS